MSGTTTATKTQAIVDSLNVDMCKEHGAIVMYLQHSWQAGGNRLAERVRRVSREEMWHMEWLAEAIYDLGGTPAVQREAISTFDTIRASLEVDVHAEEDALDHYRHTLSLLGEDDESLRRLIERIMGDEQAHHAIFKELLDELERLGEDTFKPLAWAEMVDVPRLVPNAEREYEGLLQYLWSKFICGDTDQAEKYFELSIDEMRHLEWIAEAILYKPNPQLGVNVLPRVHPLGQCDAATSRMTDYENTTMSEYMHSRDAVASEDLRKLLDRIIFQHDYHQFTLEGIRGD